MKYPSSLIIFIIIRELHLFLIGGLLIGINKIIIIILIDLIIIGQNAQYNLISTLLLVN